MVKKSPVPVSPLGTVTPADIYCRGNNLPLKSVRAC